MTTSWENAGVAMAAERITTALSALIFVIGFSVSVVAKPPDAKVVPVFKRT
jgi:hypothetical protein